MASLLTLPLELLVAVSSLLSTPDLGALRLTCKQAEKSLYEWFSKEFFTKKQFMLTEESLQVLVDISKHVSFSKKLSHVIVATNVYHNMPVQFRDETAAALWTKGYRDQQALSSTGVDYEMLTEAFRGLENLQTVGIRDFNNDQRYRDGFGASWTSWGATTVHKETGHQVQFSRELQTFVPRLFQILIRALGQAGRSTQEIEVLLRRGYLNNNAYHLPEFLQPTVKPVLQNLKKLLLTTDVTPEYRHMYANGAVAETCGGYSLRQFLGHTPNLSHLRLNLPPYNDADNKNFLLWLSKPAPDPSAASNTLIEPAPVGFAHLTSLELGQFQAQSESILDVIAKFRFTLRELSLWKLNIIDRGAPGDTATYSMSDAKPNDWAKFFVKLAGMSQLQLNYLKAGMLKQNGLYVNFKASDHDDAPLEKTKTYSGPKMSTFLTELVGATVVLWPIAREVPTDEDMDDENDEEQLMSDMEDDDDDDDNDNDDDNDE